MPVTPERVAGLLSSLEGARRELCTASGTFLAVAESCRSVAAGDIDNPQNLKLAEGLQDIIIEEYKRAVKAFVAAIFSNIEL